MNSSNTLYIDARRSSGIGYTSWLLPIRCAKDRWVSLVSRKLSTTSMMQCPEKSVILQ